MTDTSDVDKTNLDIVDHALARVRLQVNAEERARLARLLPVLDDLADKIRVQESLDAELAVVFRASTPDRGA